jgi:hypothetical protein
MDILEHNQQMIKLLAQIDTTSDYVVLKKMFVDAGLPYFVMKKALICAKVTFLFDDHKKLINILGG